MDFQLENKESELTEEFEGINESIELYSGDIYSQDKPFGYFVALTYPFSKKPMAMLVSAVNIHKETIATIGVTCMYGDPLSLSPADPASLPWGEESDVLFTGHISSKEYSNYSISGKLYNAAKYILNIEENLFNYINGKNT